MTKMKKFKKNAKRKLTHYKQMVKICSAVRQDTIDLSENIGEILPKIDVERVTILVGMIQDLGHLSKLISEAMEETIIAIEK